MAKSAAEARIVARTNVGLKCLPPAMERRARQTGHPLADGADDRVSGWFGRSMSPMAPPRGLPHRRLNAQEVAERSDPSALKHLPLSSDLREARGHHVDAVHSVSFGEAGGAESKDPGSN